MIETKLDTEKNKGLIRRRRGKQIQVRFKRSSDGNGKYRTHISLETGEKKQRSSRGPVHRLFDLKYRFTGDIPSVSRKIRSYSPDTIAGYAVKTAALAATFTVGNTMKATEDVLKASETACILTGSKAAKTGIKKCSEKYRESASDDYSKGSLFISKSAADALKGIHTHVQQKKRYRSEKLKYKDARLDLKKFRKNNYKPEIKDIKKQVRSEDKKYRIRKREFNDVSKSSESYGLRRELYRQRKKQYRKKIGELKNRKKDSGKELVNLKKIKNRQYRIKKLTDPGLLVLKPARYYGSQLKEYAVSKAAREDNDMLTAAHEAKKVTDRVSEFRNKNNRLKRQEKKHAKQTEKKNSGLRKKESRLQDNSKAQKSEKTKRKRKRSKASGRSSKTGSIISELFRDTKGKKSVKTAAGAAGVMVPVLLILLILWFTVNIFVSILSGSGFILGTYNAQDHDLSQAEAYYTKLAWTMNESIRKAGTSDWKKALKELGADTGSMKDDPDIVQWGRSSVFDYDPVYDFDRYKLWSFLCAYYYDFSASDNGDIKYWKYNDGTEKVIKELFHSEYRFEYKYNNSSYWRQLNTYQFEGGIDGCYWLADSNKVYRNSFYAKSNPSALNKYLDKDGLIHFSSDLEVLNAQDGNKRTGWFIQDQRYIITDPSGQRCMPFYSWFNDFEFGRYYNGSYFPRSYWGWEDQQCYWMSSPEDTLHWRDDLTDTCLVSYYKANEWVKECSLYYNVRQKMTFEEAILNKLGSMSNSTDRIAYYNALSGGESGGSSLYGNHQTLNNILPGRTIMDYTEFNGFGWNMKSWNSRHCKSDGDIHEGADIVCPAGTDIYAPFDCKIKSYDNQTVVLRKNNVRYWYDGTGGTKRDTEVTIENVKLKSGIKKGDNIKQGKIFAVSTDGKHCAKADNSSHESYIHIRTEIDTDGIGWDFVDPFLIIN